MIMRIRQAVKGVSWTDPRSWRHLADELDQTDASLKRDIEARAAIEMVDAMRTQLEQAVLAAMSKNRSVQNYRESGPGKIATWSHLVIKTDGVEKALDELKAFARHGPGTAELQSQAELTIKVRKALIAASWASPKSWSGLADELDRAAGLSAPIRDTEEVKAARVEFEAMRSRLEQLLLKAMGSGRSERRTTGGWSHYNLRTDEVQHALTQLRAFPRQGAISKKLDAQANLTIKLRTALREAGAANNHFGSSWNLSGSYDPSAWAPVAKLLDTVPEALRNMEEVVEARAEVRESLMQHLSRST